MPILQVTKDALTRLPDTSSGKEGILERKDLQRLLQRNIAAIDEDLMVIAEEFGEWQESARRIDLLCLATAPRVSNGRRSTPPWSTPWSAWIKPCARWFRS